MSSSTVCPDSASPVADVSAKMAEGQDRFDFARKPRATRRLLPPGRWMAALVVFAAVMGLWWGSAIAADWTFMVYLDADNDLEAAGIEDFLEMSSVGSDANVNIVVQFDRIDGEDSGYGDWTSCKRFYVLSGMTPTEANQVAGDDGDIGECNMADPATLKDFVQWGVSAYPADHYAVVLWNHGGGWRLQRAALLEALESAASDAQAAAVLGALDEVAAPTYKAVCWDDSSNDALYMKEVQSALSDLSGAGMTMDLVGFDACLMGMIEVAYEIKDSGAAVMVGSEETEDGDGWPYDTLLDDLADNPAWDPAALGAAIVSRYDAFYNYDYTLSAIDLTAVDALGATVSNFADAMRSDWNADKLSVKDAAQSVMDGIDAAVLGEAHDASLPGSHGLAIYFPSASRDFDADYNGTVIDFPADTLWDEFLSDFHAAMGGSWIASARSASQEYYYPEHVDLFDFCSNVVASDVCDVSEGFEDGEMPPGGWELISSAPGTETWTIDGAGAHDGSFGASCSDDAAADQDEVLISPVCHSPDTLNFWSFGDLSLGGGAPDDNYDVQVWLVKGEWDAGVSDDVLLGLADDDWLVTGQWAESAFDLSAYTGSYRVAFRYTGSGEGARAGLDDICLMCIDQGAMVADAGADQTVDDGETVTLDGSDSSVPDGATPGYLWTQTDGPSVSLSDETSARPTFTAPEVDSSGVSLTFSLTVTDGNGLVDTDSCRVRVVHDNEAPAADAGADQSVSGGDPVTLDGTGSTDPDDGIATYLWEQTGGTAVTLSDGGAARPTFTAPDVDDTGETLIFMLTVTDAGGLAAADTCTVEVVPLVEASTRSSSGGGGGGCFIGSLLDR